MYWVYELSVTWQKSFVRAELKCTCSELSHYKRIMQWAVHIACSLCLFFLTFINESQLGQLKEDVPADNCFVKIGAAAGAHAVDNPAQANAGFGSALDSDFETRRLEQERRATQVPTDVHVGAGVVQNLASEYV